MAKQTWKHFAFPCALLEKALSASSNLAQDRGKPLEPGWIGRFANAGIKSCTMLAVVALSLASSGAGQTAGKMPEQTRARAVTEQESASQLATEVERESWRKTILKTPRPKKGCFTAAYPETEWREVPCKTPPHKL